MTAVLVAVGLVAFGAGVAVRAGWAYRRGVAAGQALAANALGHAGVPFVERLPRQQRRNWRLVDRNIQPTREAPARTR